MQRIGFIVLPGFQMMSVASLSVFELANSEMGEPVYDLRLLSETGGSVRSSMGFGVATERLSNANFDTLMVGGSAAAGSLTPGVIRFLRRALTRSRRVPQHAPARSSWQKQVCSTAVARPRIGTARVTCRLGSQW
jgi:transcriptional regulator GlxA family with amidase domain